MYGPAVQPADVSLVQAPARRDLHLGEVGVLLIGGNPINNSFSDLGAYTGRFNNISPITSRINIPSPNLTNAYLDTPPVDTTPEPLEYAPPHTKPGGFPYTGSITPPPPTSLPPPPKTHMYPPTGRVQPRRELQIFHKWKIRGYILYFFCHSNQRGPTPPHGPTGTEGSGGGGVGDCNRIYQRIL